VDDTAMLVSASCGVPTPEKSDMNTLLLIGFVKSIKMMEAIEAKIELMDLQDRSVVADFTSDAKTGAFTVVVPGGHDYAMYVSADGFLIHSENVKAVDSTGTRTSMDILMNPCETGSSEVMRNIFFMPNAWELLPPSIADLDKLVEQLNAYPALRLEVSGHTDDGIGPVDNQHLSENRAQAVVDHLVSKGIAPGRLVAKGYGPDRPLAPNDTKEHRALNRRTEIRVL
jgi:outer membrane protein OmpA-like peptidoglycan-associated protein